MKSIARSTARSALVRLGAATMLRTVRSSSPEFFFIVGMGRSGTRFLARLLDLAPGARVMHDPVPADARAYQEAFHDELRARDYIQRYRKHDIELRAARPGVKTYGEVNSYLRRHAKPLKEAFPAAPVIHLIRDGRAVVRSMYARRTMTSKDRVTRLIGPGEADPYCDRWSSMSRFERLCWYWWVENCYLAATADWSVRFEDLIGDYTAFLHGVAEPCHCDVPREVWEGEIKTPVNETPADAIRRSGDWTSEQTDRFWEICGSVMGRHGYA